VVLQRGLPPYTEGCDADPAKIACDYPKYDLNKIVATSFAERGDAAYNLVKNFKWTNDDQNTVAKYIAEDKMTPEAAAAKWIADNPDKVDAWIE
jgi:glycine betaine/proline transport system substrate-binding protein